MNIQTVLRGVTAKLVGVDSEHVSRFHSRRGEICKPSELTAIPGLVLNRLSKKVKLEPWMAPSAVTYLKSLLSREDDLLELGSGASTAWYADRVRRVVSLEPNLEWATRVSRDLAGRPNTEVRTGAVVETFAAALDELRPTVLIVDHSDEPLLTRPDAIRIAITNRAPPRVIVLDDSDRKQYALAADILKDWSNNRFSGFRDNPLRLTETTIFVRH